MNKYRIEKTNKFKKEYKKMKTRNNFDEKEFIKVVDLLAKGEPLPEKYCNHLLEPKSERILGMSHQTRLASDLYEKGGCIDTNFN